MVINDLTKSKKHDTIFTKKEVMDLEIYERIKELRKNHLHMSQESFGARLGVSRSVINNIERNALQRPE